MRHIKSLCSASLLLLLTMGSSTPPPVDIIKSHVKLLAETTVVRIQKVINEFPMPPDIYFIDTDFIPHIAPEKPVEGLSSIAEKLKNFNVILLNLLNLEGMDQIQQDIVSLRDIAPSLAASFSCPLKDPESDGQLSALLKNNVTFQISIAQVALTRLQEFLTQFINSLDQLKTC
ncbi:hypothetical protein AAFF_G00386510 [Aldrovandia affinis]|uniref:Leptin n=1 Tax=Aldrovandia affinis TaxID=143900 RepID=A0AAD7SF40_9TELE|nr:hypothetical protein AAFF_G00386510 [Aldrovandia affinis]